MHSFPAVKRGYTLIELLVVMFIICLLTFIIIIKTDKPHSVRELLSFASLMKAQMEVAKEEAIFSMAVIKLKINDKTYQLFQYTEDDSGPKWLPLEVKDPFWQLYKIPDFIDLSLENTASTMEVSNFNFTRTNSEIIFYPSGEISPFRLTFRGKKVRTMIEIIGNANGNLRLERRSNE